MLQKQLNRAYTDKINIYLCIEDIPETEREMERWRGSVLHVLIDWETLFNPIAAYSSLLNA